MGHQHKKDEVNPWYDVKGDLKLVTLNRPEKRVAQTGATGDVRKLKVINI